MSGADYVSLKTPKRGLRSLGDDIHHEGAFLLEPNRWSQSNWSETVDALLWAPFHARDRPTIWTASAVMVLVFVGCLVNGWVLIAAQLHALAIAGDAFIRAILVALVAAIMFYVTQLWTKESKMCTYIYPEISMAMIPSLRVGIIPAVVYGIFQFAGYAAAGGILRALNGVTPGVTNVAISSQSYWLYWFGATFVVFNYVYNAVFKQTATEWSVRQHSRASKAAAVGIFAVTVAFYTLGLFTFSSGLYVTGVIVTGNNRASFAGDSAVPWAVYVFVALLAVPATVGILYALFYYLTSDYMPAVSLPGGRSEGYENMKTEARVPPGISHRMPQKIHVEY